MIIAYKDYDEFELRRSDIISPFQGSKKRHKNNSIIISSLQDYKLDKVSRFTNYN